MSLFREIIENGLVASFLTDKSLILILDIDFSMKRTFMGGNPRLKPDGEVYNSLIYI